MTEEGGKGGRQGGTGHFTTAEWLQHMKFSLNLLLVMERSNGPVSPQACPNFNAGGMELPLLLCEAGLDRRVLPVHPRDGAGSRKAHSFWHCSEKVGLTPLPLGNGRKKHRVLRGASRATADASPSER